MPTTDYSTHQDDDVIDLERGFQKVLPVRKSARYLFGTHPTHNVED